MNCYVCAIAGREQSAVAQCRNCNAGLCLEHLRVDAATAGPGGLRHACNHGPPAAPR